MSVQVLNALKTRQVTHYVLNHLNGYIKNLEKVGLLQGKEVSHLHDAVQVRYPHYCLDSFVLTVFFFFFLVKILSSLFFIFLSLNSSV